MKTYYLRLTQDDFSKVGTTWTSGLIDLYDNESPLSEAATPAYRNFSITKVTQYGVDTIGDNTWVGLSQLDYQDSTPHDADATPIQTELGEVWGDRFVDHSGRLDIGEWIVNFDNVPGEGVIYPTLDFYHIDDSDLEFPGEWASKTNINYNRAVGILNAYRYAKVVLYLETDQTVDDVDVELLIKVRIGEPVQAPFYGRSQKILDDFPEWMDFREVENRLDATPETATPQTLGSGLINAVAGEWLEHMESQLNWVRLQQFISTASIDQPDWIYATQAAPTQVVRVEGDGVELARLQDYYSFLATTATDDAFFWDRANRTIYTRKSYTEFLVNWEEYDQEAKQVWNWFDDFGYALDIRRHYLETNEIYKKRILDVYRNAPGVGLENFKLALRRELNLWLAYDGATPDSDYQGATPAVLEIQDIEEHTDFVDYDGVPTDKFIALVEELAAKYPTTWGYFKWGQGIYDAGGLEGEGYSVLPYRFDAEELPDENTQSGVGDGEDLFVYRPDAITGPREFEARLKIRGRQKSVRDEYRKVTLRAQIWGTGFRINYNNPEVSHWFTVRVQYAGTYYYHRFQMAATSNEDNDGAATASCYDEYMFLDATGQPIEGHTWYEADGTEHLIGPDEISGATPSNSLFVGSALTDLDLFKGYINFPSLTATETPASADYQAWFAEDPATILSGTGSGSIGSVSGSSTSVVMKPLTTSSGLGAWSTEKAVYTIEMNGVLPDQSTQSYTLAIPDFEWDPYVAVPARSYSVQIESTEGVQLGATTTGLTGETLELPSSLIYLNGGNSWVSGVYTLTAASTTSFVFSTGTNADYPIQDVPSWTLFEADQTTTIEGIVDENGPWRNGAAPPVGNTNYNWHTAELDRSDFGVPHTTDYIVTWVGVETIGDPRVIVWLDTNSINPAVDDGTSVTYPDSAIVESLDAGVYSFDPIIIRARLEPGASPEWYPQIHSGWFYDRNSEYFMFARPVTEIASGEHYVLDNVARQGAPIIIETHPSTPTDYRQVAFWEDGTPSELIIAKETVSGTGTDRLYVGYSDIYDIRVFDLDTNEEIDLFATFSPTNEVTTMVDTDRDRDYEVTYKINESFFADNEWVEDGEQRTKLTFDAPLPTAATVTYESSKYDPATPVDIPLHTFYTIADEGFIYLSHNEYDYAAVQGRISPSNLLADGEDYLLVTLKAVDSYGNPKPNEEFGLATTFGTFEDSTVSTNDDGFAVTFLNSQVSTTVGSGYVTVSNDTLATINYSVTPQPAAKPKLSAVPNQTQIPADGVSTQWVKGVVEDTDRSPIPYAIVRWRKGRYMYEVWQLATSTSSATPGQAGEAGQVVADANGFFEVGPFIAATPGDPGYWFVAAESEEASPSNGTPDYDLVGDAVAWYEYPRTSLGVEGIVGLPRTGDQMATPAYIHPRWKSDTNANAFPVTYNWSSLEAPATPVSFNYSIEKWYALNRYDQYQAGLLGTETDTVDHTSSDDWHPDHKDY